MSTSTLISVIERCQKAILTRVEAKKPIFAPDAEWVRLMQALTALDAAKAEIQRATAEAPEPERPRVLHVIPIGDTGPQDGIHNASRDCWCHPYRSENLMIHHAYDGRESKERQRQRTGQGWVIIGEVEDQA